MNKLTNTKGETFEVGEIAWAYYFKFEHGNYSELDFFFCEILELGNEYSTCKLFFGDSFDPKRVKGTVNDVCTADLSKISDNVLEEMDRRAIAEYKNSKAVASK